MAFHNPLPHIRTVGEAIESARNVTLLGAGKSAAGAVGGAVANIGGQSWPALGTAVTLGLTAAVSAGIVQIEHQSSLKRMSRFYKDELGAVLGKPEKKIGVKDLEKMAGASPQNGLPVNPIMAEEIQQSRRRRNLGVALSAIASVTTYILLKVATLGAATGFAAVAAQALVGVATYFAIKEPLHWLGDKAFGTDKRTTHDRIKEIANERAQDKRITREQVFEVFVAANPDLAAVIKNRFEEPYDDLDLQHKKMLTDNLGKLMQVDEITQAINDGRIHAQELAFVAIGQHSGVPLRSGEDTGKPHGLVGVVKEKLHNMAQHFMPKHKQEAYESPITEKDGKASFAERVGRKHTPEMTHLERVEQGRSEPSVPNLGQ